jgi:inorganic pyrophosphatase
MTKLNDLPTHCKDSDALRVVIETPRGSRVKLALDVETGVITYERPLPLGVAYPYDWGFIPSTRAPDGDPVDVMVLSSAATAPGIVIPCHPLGVVQLEETSKEGERLRNDRVIARPTRVPASESFAKGELPAELRKQLEQFFRTAVLFEGKDLEVLGWADKEAAEKLIEASRTNK